MKRVNYILGSFLLSAVGVLHAEQLSLQQVLQKVIDHYPSIQSASLQVEKASQENIKAESQLAWQMNGNAGVSRDTGLFGTSSDRVNLGAGVNRRLENGGVLGFNASISRDDAEEAFAPTIPNPVTKTRVDVNYRQPLQKGSENAQYEESKTAAQAQLQLVQSDKVALYDALATEVIDLYLATSITEARLQNSQNKIDRGLRLKKYINNEVQLGLSEEKDILQVNARLEADRAEKQSLEVLLKRQIISLNRLMDRPWDKSFSIDLQLTNMPETKYDIAYQKAIKQSTQLKQIDARLMLAESAIRLSRDQRENELDLVMYLGNESNQGDLAVGDYDESGIVGGISLEFKRALDKSGLDAELRQAHLDRELALQDKKLVLQNLQYTVASLLAELQSTELAVKAFNKSVNAEKSKLVEARHRYKDGRIETDLIIEFEGQLANAELAYELQKIELARRYYQLNLLDGSLWKNIVRTDTAYLTTRSQEIN